MFVSPFFENPRINLLLEIIHINEQKTHLYLEKKFELSARELILWCKYCIHTFWILVDIFMQKGHCPTGQNNMN